MESSGTSPIATSSASAVTLLTATAPATQGVTIVNEGAAAGFVSVDGGETWLRMPGGPSSRFIPCPSLKALVKAKRDGATDMTGLYADVV